MIGSFVLRPFSTLEYNLQMTLFQRSIFPLLFLVAFATNGIGLAEFHCDEKSGGPFEADVESWIHGLNDASYRIRRESFLKLCDRNIPLDAWLDTESKSGDQHRTAIANWLKRLRRSNGTLAERAEMIRDYEALRNNEDSALERFSVLERYIDDGQWERLLEIVALLEPPIRIQLLRDEGKLQHIINKAWKSENESFVPRLLELVLSPMERAHANRLWRSLGMPSEWKVSQNSNLPSVKVIELEAEGKIDEAVTLAEKFGLRNLVEPILMRSNRWDKWLSMDLRRTPIMSLENIGHQKAGMLLLLGRFEEANAQLDKIRTGPEASELSKGSAVLALAMGRTAEFEAFVDQQSENSAFFLLRSLGDVHAAFQQVGLDDLSLDSVQKWLDTKGYLKRHLAEELNPRRKPREFPLADYADLFFQIGLKEQGELVESYLIAEMKRREADEGDSVWTPLFFQWIVTNERVKAIYYWKKFLIRNQGRQTKPKQLGMAYQSVDEQERPFEVMYPDLPHSASLVFEHLFALASTPEKGVEINDADQRRKAIELAVDQLEDLHAGRWPRDWHGRQPLLDLRKSVHLKSIEAKNSSDVLIELASLFDSLQQTQLAIETVDMCLGDSTANEAKVEFLKRLGQLDAACDLLIEEFQNEASNVGLLVECTETLEHIGRFGEMDRYRIQGLSSVLNDWESKSNRPVLALPPSKLVQVLMEQHWYRDRIDSLTGMNAAVCLSRQYGALAKNDLSQAKQAANYARIEALIRMKNDWPNEGKEIGRLLSNFGDTIQSLILEAISNRDRELADKLFRVAFRCKPLDIDMPILVVPVAEGIFGKELADQWFDLFYQPLLKHLDEFPNDSLIGNNTAWMAALCNRHLEKARDLASKVTVSNPDPTYLDTLAEIEYRLGNVARAIELSERCLQIEPKDKQHREQLKRFRAGKPVSRRAVEP